MGLGFRGLGFWGWRVALLSCGVSRLVARVLDAKGFRVQGFRVLGFWGVRGDGGVVETGSS